MIIVQILDHLHIQNLHWVKFVLLEHFCFLQSHGIHTDYIGTSNGHIEKLLGLLTIFLRVKVGK